MDAHENFDCVVLQEVEQKQIGPSGENEAHQTVLIKAFPFRDTRTGELGYDLNLALL
jgi:hypothetical protein